MNKKVARITNDKKLLLGNEVVEGNRYSLNEHGKLYTKNILEGNKFSIDDEFIEVGEFIEGYPFIKPVIDDSLVLWLDGSTGNNYDKTSIWRDLIGNGNDGQLMNFNYDEDSGWVDGGLRFDGVDDYVDCGNINSYSTVELIFKYSSLQEVQYPTLLNQNEQSSTGQFIWLYTNGLNTTLDLQVGNDGYQAKSMLNFIDYDKLVHMVIVFNNDGVLIYKNGHLYENLIFTNGGKAPTTGRLYVGAYQGKPSHIFNGNMDLIRIYNRALTDEEILQNYKAGQCSPLLAMRGDVIG